MKTTYFLLCFIFALSAGQVYAQQNDAVKQEEQPASKRDREPDRSYRTGEGTQTTPGQSGREQPGTDGMVEVQAEQIPETLRKTLGHRRFKGWEEHGTLYQDPSSGGYVLMMDASGKELNGKTYRFDKDGKQEGQ